MLDGDNALARMRNLRQRIAELRSAFSEAEFLYHGGTITHAEEIALLRPIMRGMKEIAAEMRGIIRQP